MYILYLTLTVDCISDPGSRILPMVF